MPAVFILAMLMGSMASDAPAVEEKPPLIDTSNAFAKPTESAEASIAIRQHRQATALNRFIFQGNVLQGTGDIVDHWMVMFCPSWHEKCQSLLPSFELLGVQWENKLNKAVMSSSARFAKVDCATEKGLCVSLDIDDYPSVVHYRNGQRVASWESGAPGLVRFLKQELEPSKRRPRAAVPKSAGAKPKSQASCASDGATPAADKSTQAKNSHRLVAVLLQWMQFAVSPWRTLCFVVMLLAAAHGAMAFVANHVSAWGTQSSKPCPVTCEQRPACLSLEQ